MERWARCSAPVVGAGAGASPRTLRLTWDAPKQSPAQVTTGSQQKVALLLGFDTLGHDLHAQVVRHHDDGFAQGKVGGALPGAAQRLVNLDVVDVEFLQIGQRRVAGAKVVQRDAGCRARARL